MKEIYKDIPNYEGLYQVSNLGNVKSLERKDSIGRFVKGKIRIPISDKDGYLGVSLSKNGIEKRRKIHQLVLEIFENKYVIKNKLVVNHINFIKSDNRLENLELISVRENSNQKHLKSSSKYVGVSFDKQRKKWKSQIRINRKSKYLGYFTSEYDAHLAYQNELKLINI